MEITKKYWKSLDELNNTAHFEKSKNEEFPREMSTEEFLSDDDISNSSSNRRDFLKFLGFSIAAATVAACEAPVIKAIPYVNKPENVTPGMPTWYASTYYDGATYASILVKTREGRPIHIKGHRDFGFTKGNTTPQVIASVLGLYDSQRLQNPSIKGVKKSWKKIDSEFEKSLSKSRSVSLITGTIISPTINEQILKLSNRLKAEGKTFNHIQYDACSYSGIRAANLDNFGKAFIPDYDFSKAKTIISFGADFLATWLLPTQFQHQYGVSRNPDNSWMSKHFQFESVMSITGSNADYRGMIKPSEELSVLSYIWSKLNKKSPTSKINPQVKKVANEAVHSLRKSTSESLLVSGSNDKNIQLMINKINHKLGAYGKTILLGSKNEIKLHNGSDLDINKFVDEIVKGKGSEMIIFQGVNPVYNHPKGKELAKALKSKKYTFCLSSHMDETASVCKVSCAESNPLESWQDFNPKGNHFSISQPTIRPLYNTASLLENLLIWNKTNKRTNKNTQIAYNAIFNHWASSNIDWNMFVHNSCIEFNQNGELQSESLPYKDVEINKSNSHNGIEVILYQKTGIGNGSQANNPWLQELPDPISKVTWDNYFTMNPSEMEKGGFATTYDQENGLHLATLTCGKQKITLPVYPLPGQTPGTIGVALGYGRGENGEAIGKAAFQTKEYGGHKTDENGKPEPIGKNVFRLIDTKGQNNLYNTYGVIKKDGEKYPIAATQIHHTVMGRHSVVRETTLSKYKKETTGQSYNPDHKLQKLDEHGHHVEKHVSEFDLWDAHPVENIGHRWAMTIDLNACFGCGSCLIACQSENNVPVVGKDEVRRGREMHWMRIDRYFSSDQEASIGTRNDKDTFDFGKAEIASENPKVVHMPMMCQQCNHAPCETVCPVAATTHSNEGLNQMTYNRCIGTRYCANNCPYKVRRFNWFNYPSYKKFTEVNPAQDDIGRMVLNPDVTVRTRGVMEKCSFCVQEIQAAKLVAKKAGRALKDGDVDCACASSCPADAISFGDWNDVNSSVRKNSEDKRSYQALEEIGVKPNIWYKTKVRNEENKSLDKLQKLKHHGNDSHGNNKKHDGHH